MHKTLNKLLFVSLFVFGSTLFMVLLFPKTFMGDTRKCIAYA